MHKKGENKEVKPFKEVRERINEKERPKRIEPLK